MFNNISWGLFILYTSGALVVYYFVLIVSKGSGWMVRNRKTQGLPLFKSPDSKRTWLPITAQKAAEREGGTTSNPQVLQSIVHDLVDEVQAYFASVEKDATKDNILIQLRSIAIKYPSIKGSIYEEGVNSLIGVSCQHHCSILVSEAEVASIWK